MLAPAAVLLLPCCWAAIKRLEELEDPYTEVAREEQEDRAGRPGAGEPSQGRCRTPEPWETRFSITPGHGVLHHRSDNSAVVNSVPDTDIFHEYEGRTSAC